MGCLMRAAGAFLVLLVLIPTAWRLLERPARIPPLGPRERDTVVETVRWRSREAAGTGPETVVYLHGFLSSSATWKKVLAPASAGRRAVAVDLPGFGFSDRPWPFDYTVPGQALALSRYLDARGFDRVVLVGNSLGGAVCLIVAAIRPERVSGLVLVDSVGPRTRIPWGFLSLRTPLVGEAQIELLVRPIMELGLRHRLYARANRVGEETVDDWWKPIPVPGTRRAALVAIRSNRRGFEDLPQKISAPTLVLWGQEDRLLPVEEGRRLASQIRGAKLLVLPDAGHLPQEEKPREFGRAVADFLESGRESEASFPSRFATEVTLAGKREQPVGSAEPPAR
jgi:pimeloyl-ACP methyl ester carboxylesterase